MKQTRKSDKVIAMYLHCSDCIKEMPRNTTPHDWTSLVVGVTEKHRIAVWCKRHDMLVGIIGTSDVGHIECDACSGHHE